MNIQEYIQQINEAAEYIQSQIPFTPDVAVILGSGLGPLADEVEDPIVIDYNNIPNFAVSTVQGHEGKLIAGTVNGTHVLVMKGRFHYYEGHDMSVVTLPVRVFSKMGIKNLLVTNAAGGIKDCLKPGSIMLITDHLSFMCPSPLMGPNLDEFGPRFKDMTEVYSKSLTNMAIQCASRQNIDVETGVYCYFRGPQYETPAEIRAVRMIGADAAGMSTVPEAIVARHCGINILGISLITNKAAGLSSAELNHKEVQEIAKKAEHNMVALVKDILGEWK